MSDLREQIKKQCFGLDDDELDTQIAYRDILDVVGKIEALIQEQVRLARKVTGETSDGYHTFNELYDYRRVYNAALFNEWARQGKYDVHKSLRHSDGELCFGGGWFVVVAELPTGQVTNHYEDKYYDEFRFIERERANKYDGHTPEEALNRIKELKK